MTAIRIVPHALRSLPEILTDPTDSRFYRRAIAALEFVANDDLAGATWQQNLARAIATDDDEILLCDLIVDLVTAREQHPGKDLLSQAVTVFSFAPSLFIGG